MTDLPQTMFAAILKHDGYSGTATGPAIENAADWLEEAEVPKPEPGPGSADPVARGFGQSVRSAFHQGGIRAA